MKMYEWFLALSPIWQALLATCFTWLVTATGAALVFFVKEVNKLFLDSMLGFAAGVMIAASYWSLLAPAIELSEHSHTFAWAPAAIGFMSGGIFIGIIDKLLPHLHPGYSERKAEGLKTSWNRSVLLVLAITLHNIPEGLAIGVAFGAVALGHESATITAAIALAFGIGLQNFPEGVSVALPLRREGFSRIKSFWYGQLSAVVEPIAGVIGAAAVILIEPLLPYALSFAAGAMIFVVVEELIPAFQMGKNTDIGTIALLFGFTIMMILDVAFG